jgi:TonB family protein
VAVHQDLPPWRGTFEDGFLRGRSPATGVLEVVIDQRGRVSSARLATPMHPLYDERLLSAARRWEYQPAMKDGKPVPYRKVIEVRMADAGSARIP